MLSPLDKIKAKGRTMLSPWDKLKAKAKAEPKQMSRAHSGRYQSKKHDHHVEPENLRDHVRLFVEGHRFETTMGMIVIFNFFVICWQVNEDAACVPLPPEFASVAACRESLASSVTLQWVERGLLAIYTLEVLLRGYAERTEFFKFGWNDLDLVVVLAGIVSELLLSGAAQSAVTFMRLLRTVRLIRMFRLLIAFRELYVIFLSLVSTCKSLLVASVFLLVLLSMWSCILVEHLHPVVSSIDFEGLYGCTRCSSAFSTIMKSNLTLFQSLVAGDGWGLINIPVIEIAPWTAPLIFGSCMTVTFGLMNLILAVVIQRVTEARDHDADLKAAEHMHQHANSKHLLLELCSRLDEDGSGNLTLEELAGAYREDEEFQILLTSMDIREEELGIIFSILDTDSSGEVSYEEFCEEIIMLQTRDMRTMMMFMKVNIVDTGKLVAETLQRLDHLDDMLRQSTEPAQSGQQEPAACDAQVAALSASRDEGSKPTVNPTTERVLHAVSWSELKAPAWTTALPWDGRGMPLASVLSRHAQDLDTLKGGVVQCVEAQLASLADAIQRASLLNPSPIGAEEPSWAAARPPRPGSWPPGDPLQKKQGDGSKFAGDGAAFVNEPCRSSLLPNGQQKPLVSSPSRPLAPREPLPPPQPQEGDAGWQEPQRGEEARLEDQGGQQQLRRRPSSEVNGSRAKGYGGPLDPAAALQWKV